MTLIFHSGHTRIFRENPAQRLAFFQYGFYLEFGQELQKPHFPEKIWLPTLYRPFTPLKINVFCALGGSLRLHSSCGKRGALSVPNCTWPFFSELAEEKELAGTRDPTALHGVIITQNACFRQQVYHCISSSHLQSLKTCTQSLQVEFILPSHMWDLCFIRCLSATPKLYTDHPCASSGLSTDVYRQDCASVGFGLHGSGSVNIFPMS